MVLLQSTPIPLGQSAKPFTLTSVDGKLYSLDCFSHAKALVLMFICNHCPYVKAIEDRLLELANEMTPLGVQFVAICSNDDTDYPEDAPSALLERWRTKKYGFPYLIDENQNAARDYGAVCTPDLYVFDAQRKLAYHGRLDDSWKDPKQVQKRDLRDALIALLAGEQPSSQQPPSMGCSIKWKKSS